VNRADQRLLQVEDLDHLPLERVTIAEALRARGYATASIGKWHLGGEGYSPTEQGFDINIAGGEPGAPSNYLWPYRSPVLRELSATGREGEELTERQGEEAAKFIAANRGRPFFLYLPFYAVHTPIQARPELVAKYEARARASGLADARTLDAESGRPHRIVQSHPTYAGLVETMDVAVGRVLRALEENGVAGRTVVIFSSDNGGLAVNQNTPTSNLPLRAGKGWLYEGGIRVPLIVRWPGRVAPGSTYSGPVISNDFFPTVLEMAGISPPGGPDAMSLLPALTGRAMDRGTLFWHYPHYSDQGGPPGAAIRDGDLKLIEFFEDRRVELYDLRADPGETRNLAGSMAGQAAELRRTLEEWRRAVGAQVPAGPNPRFHPDSVPAPFVP
jgi:arylsulfatase A-like enzyme